MNQFLPAITRLNRRRITTLMLHRKRNLGFSLVLLQE
jgi:hypothetical protein